MGVFQKIGNALARLMYGRNGVDQLSLAIVVGSLVLDLVSMFVAPHHLWLGNALYLVSIAAWAFALFRIFSRNLTKPAVGELDVADEEQPPECQGPPCGQGPQILHLQEL